ncbi:sporulation integral membrane protein YtvI [Metabacillus mangrovi]|uniref:sporulation integral membrane protein YtvI n=1 Tax=Metabacillus mangrovi TaxID=1491830 RepID=UPI0013917F7E|nr:sporulation integral membrane protein YtvI [Metabacillus mangrovi]
MNHFALAIVRVLAAAAVLAASASILYLSFPIVYPFILAFFLAWLIKKPADFVHAYTGMPAGLSAAAVLAALLAAAGGLTALAALETAAFIQNAALSLPVWLNSMSGAFNHILSHQVSPLIAKTSEQFSALNPTQQTAVLTELKKAGNSLIGEAGSLLRECFNTIPAVIMWIPNAASVAVIIVFAAFFICRDWDRIILLLNRKLPEPVLSRFYMLGRETGKAFTGLIKAQILLNLITMAAVFPGLLFLGVPHALTVTLLIGFVDFIPYAGSGLVFIPWVLYLLLTGQTKLASGLAVLFLLIAGVRQILEPKIYSRSIGLNPLVTLIGIYAGYKCFGLIGMAAGPLVLTVLQSLYKLRLFHDIWGYLVRK